MSFHNPPLHSLFSPKALEQEIEDGYVSRQTTTVPNIGTLSIYCYTKTAQYEEHWNEVTTVCRGLIVHDDTGLVIGRPFAKFFNFGQVEKPTWTDGVELIASNKMDGSLGICFWDGTRWRIATKGSFASDQAIVGNDLLELYLPDATDPNALGGPGTTTMFEIVYPENRIVVDYGTIRGLWFLTCIKNATGEEDYRPSWSRRFPRATTFALYSTAQVAGAVATPTFDDREGIVATWMTEGRPPFRLKFKNGRYLRLHSLMTKMTARKIWTILVEEGHQALTEFIKDAPDEFQIWAQETADRLLMEHQTKVKEVSVATVQLLRKLNICLDGSPVVGQLRKEFASEVADLPDKGLMFKLLDGKSIVDEVWRKLYPAHETPFRPAEEE